MKKLLLMLVLCVILITSGCSMTDTAGERNRRILQISDLQSKMLVDDVDYFLLIDRSSRLTRWHARVGH